MILGELNFKQFVEKNNIHNLPLNEQVRQYDYYIESLVYGNQKQNKGPKRLRLQITGFLLQENLFILQQENGSGIYITSYA